MGLFETLELEGVIDYCVEAACRVGGQLAKGPNRRRSLRLDATWGKLSVYAAEVMISAKPTSRRHGGWASSASIPDSKAQIASDPN